jgi:predicted nucleic acid-binding protein
MQFAPATRTATHRSRSVVAVLVDTTVLIDLLRGQPAARDYLRTLTTVPFASEVTRVEVLRGVRAGERDTTERLFDALRWVAIDEAIARRAGELGRRWDRHRPGIALADLVIAATAEHLDAELATTNVRHFPMLPTLAPPYSG